MADNGKNTGSSKVVQKPPDAIITRRLTRRSLETATASDLPKIRKIQSEVKPVEKDPKKTESRKGTPANDKVPKPKPSEKKKPITQLPAGSTPALVPPGIAHARLPTPVPQPPGTVPTKRTLVNPRPPNATRLRLPVFPRSPGTIFPRTAVCSGEAQPRAPTYKTPICFPSPTLTSREDLYRIYGPPSASCIKQAADFARVITESQDGKKVQSPRDDFESLNFTVTENSSTATVQSTENGCTTHLIDFNSPLSAPETANTGDILNEKRVDVNVVGFPNEPPETMLKNQESGPPIAPQQKDVALSDSNKQNYYLVTDEMLHVFAINYIQASKENSEPNKVREELHQNFDDRKNQTEVEEKNDESEHEVERKEEKKKGKKQGPKKPKKKFIDKLCEKTAKKTLGFYRQQFQYVTGSTGNEPSSLSNQGFYHQGTLTYGHFPPGSHYGPGSVHRPFLSSPSTFSAPSFAPHPPGNFFGSYPPRAAYRLPTGAVNVLSSPGSSHVPHFGTSQVPAFTTNTVVPVFPNNSHGPRQFNGSQLPTSFGNPVFGEQPPVHVYSSGVNYGMNQSGAAYGPVPSSGIFYGPAQHMTLQVPEPQSPQVSAQYPWPSSYGTPSYQ